jgi:hypothetical protein
MTVVELLRQLLTTAAVNLHKQLLLQASYY